MTRVCLLGLLFFLWFSEIAMGQSVTLSMGVGQETMSGLVVVPINLRTSGGAQVAALQWSWSYPTEVTGVTFAAGTAAANAGKSITCGDNTCLLHGVNTKAMPDGVVATLTFRISNSLFLNSPIQISDVIAASPEGESIWASGVRGLALLLSPDASPNGSILPPQPVLTADSVSPSGSGGVRETFTFVFSNGQSATNLAAAAMLFASTLDAENSCFIVYDRGRGAIQLQSDDLQTSQTKPAASVDTLENSQCTIGATSVTEASLTTSITVAITFKSTFTGRKNIYLYGANEDGSVNTGWTQRGAYTVSALPPPVPTADSVSPDSGKGFTQTFTFIFSDSQSSANLAAAAMLFAPALVGRDSCYIVYDRKQGTVQLEWDDANGADVKPVSSYAQLKNGQCTIGTVSVVATEVSTRITMDVTFANSFTGAKNIYLYSADGDGSINTGWVQKGTWTPDAGIPQ